MHLCEHPVTSVTHQCDCPIGVNHYDNDYRKKHLA